MIDFTNFESTVVDRVCGKGNFLLAVIYRFVENGADIEHVVNNIIHGYDISESQIDKCCRFIKLATGINPKNVQVKDTLNMTVKKLFTYEVGNYPFNDSSEEVGRNTDKVKENTADLDSKFYLSKKVAENRAVIMRAGCLAKSSKVREHIMSDSFVHTIMHTSGYFDVSPDTMCVFSRTDPVAEKKFIDKNNNVWTYKTDKNTKLSINMTKEIIPLVEKVFEMCKVDNFGNHWLRSPILRSDSKVNKMTGIDFVQITGTQDAELELDKFSGNIDNVKMLDKWKVITNVNASSTAIGPIKIAKPGVATSNSVVYFAFSTEQEAIDAKAYLESPFIKFITPFFKSSAGNSSEFFANIPYINFSDKKLINDLNGSINDFG